MRLIGPKTGEPTALTNLFLNKLLPAFVFAAVLGSILLFVFDDTAENSKAPAEAASPGKDFKRYTEGLDFNQHVTIIELDDGTRCAVLSSFRAGGIDCEWKPRD